MMIYPGRNPKDFLSKPPSLLQKLFFVQPSIQAFPSVYVKAFDVARYQEAHEVNYQTAYANGYRLVIIKSTEGNNYVDPMFDWHWNHALDAGFYIMTYHFFYDGASGESQADWCLTNTQRMRDAVLGHTAIWNDNENRAGSPVITVTTRRSRVQALHNTLAMNINKHGEYCSPSLWQSRMGNDLLSKYGDGWVAHWTSATSPTLPIGWTESATKLWQTGVYPTYSWVEPVPGVLGTVDVDRWFGTEQSLRDYLGYDQETHSHPDLELAISLLDRRLTVLENVG
jgi:lysozyme